MEQDIIKFIKKSFNPKGDISFAGEDDTSFIRFKSGGYLFSTDMLVEGTHFISGEKMYNVGRKCAAVSISDIAAMGGEPLFFMVSLGLKKGMSLNAAKDFFRGVKFMLKKFNIKLIGGDTVGSNVIIADGMIIGKAKGKVLKRSGAKKGDVIFATGKFGFSFETGWHYKFVPRVKEIDYLKKKIKINSCIDASDGLYASLRIISKESSVKLKVDADSVIPRKKFKNKADLYNSMFFDGEDFELVFTGKCTNFYEIEKDFFRKFGVPLSVIGYVEEGKGIEIYDGKGRRLFLKGKEYEHFK